MSAVENFLNAPSESLLLSLTVKELINVADYYSIEITLPRSARKDRLVDFIRECLKRKKVLPFFCTPVMDPDQTTGQKSEAEASAISHSMLTFEQQKAILQMQNEQKRLDAVEREKEHLLEQEKIHFDAVEREKERLLEQEKIHFDAVEREKECLLEQEKIRLA